MSRTRTAAASSPTSPPTPTGSRSCSSGCSTSPAPTWRSPPKARRRRSRGRCAPSPTRCAAPTLAIDLALAAVLPPAGAAAELIEAVIQILVENSRQAGAAPRPDRRAGARRPPRHPRRRRRRRRPRRPTANGFSSPSTPAAASRAAPGLGLSIARSLLASCGGTIASLPADKGACFEVELPAAAGP